MAYEVDTSCYESWADPETIRTAASDLSKKAGNVEADVDACSTTWGSLQSFIEIDDYSSSTQFKESFVEIKRHGGFVADGGEKAETALKTFADAIDAELGIVENILGQIAYFRGEVANLDETDATAVAEAEGTQRWLQGLVDGTQTNYENAEKACANTLNGIYDKVLDQGGAIAGPWGTAALTVAGNSTAFVRIDPSRKVPVYGYRTPAYDPRDYYTTKKIVSANGQVKYAAYMKPGVTLPAPERYVVRHQNPWSIVDPVEAQRQNLKMPTAMRAGGWIVNVAGGVITINSEYEERYNELLRTRPDLSEDELENEAGQAGLVRGGTKVAVIAGAGMMGMAIGTAIPIPGVGTLAGGVIGLAVGGVLAYGAEALGLADAAADVVENVYETITPEPVKEVVGEVGEVVSDVGGAISDGWNSLWD
ncbi:hypothetical protein [Zhihengliuella sp.]|uniref:hypothetical protein n=1 Tax=Zhihengliuella sp. TaxID=1954483 RepID=UPI0028123E8E|nr:hypothetical protein [Zhihengliuella sp.]